MKIAGFTFVRNAIKYDYPIIEAITSILPICDELVVAVGNSEDGTLELIQSIDSPKIKIIETIWDDSLREGGRVLAVETDKALAAISPDADWCFYIQGDEVVHEKYLPVIKKAMEDNLHKPEVEGLLFKYLHFYGSYNYVADAHRWYRREIRVVRNTGNVLSYRDAQGFRTKDNQKLKVKLIDAFIYHYGWVKSPEQMRKKQKESSVFWHDDTQMQKINSSPDYYDFSGFDSLEKFTETHPIVMKERIIQKNWVIDLDISKKKFSLKNLILYYFEKWTGIRPFDFRNYKVIRK